MRAILAVLPAALASIAYPASLPRMPRFMRGEIPLPHLPRFERTRRLLDRACSIRIPGWVNFLAECPHRPGADSLDMVLARMKPMWPAWTLAGFTSVSAAVALLMAPAASAAVHHWLPPQIPETMLVQQKLASEQAYTAAVDEYQTLAIIKPLAPGMSPAALARSIAAIPSKAVMLADLAELRRQAQALAAANTPPAMSASLQAFESCVIAHESQGVAQVTNASGHWGLFQFAERTWEMHGGNAPGAAIYAFGSAPANQQVHIFVNTVAADGDSDWRPSDGCVYGGGPVMLSTVAAPATGLMSAALNWALAQQGKPYIWGGTGPSGFDCSGLVYAAYLSQGKTLPRTTYDMLASVGSILIPDSTPHRGDLAFYGTGHVELYWAPGVTFGAQQPGTLVGFHNYGGGWSPTAFYRIA